MARPVSKRGDFLRKNFMHWHNEGYSIKEIASFCYMSECTVYQTLQEIADLNGVSRESLLEVVHKPHEVTKNPKKSSKSMSPVPCEFVLENCNKLLKDIEELKKQVKIFLST